MSDTPKFTVIDRRKIKAEEEQEAKSASHHETGQAPAPEAPKEPETPSAGPQLVVNEPKPASASDEAAEAEQEAPEGLPPAPTADEIREQKMAYDVAAQRLEDIVRAQNPAMGAQPPIGFENLVQQIYVSAMIQMGAGTQEGQRPRVDILGARQTIDLLGVLAEKTKGNLSEAEDRALQTVLFEVRMAFMELTSMITLQSMQPPQPPPPGKR
ncbi:MAG: DUF1844 domain-containing protein [Terracidiphilus sp.]|nr:DUF1844 domain-containing protein [Terracidiphilus sp.]MDR3776041.1 DUF1844 domain-containing protein [Terracidiphilus sp.]